MMKHEFEELAGRTVTNEQYEAIEKLYMDSTMTKQEFVKSIRGLLKNLQEPEREYMKLTMCVPNEYGYRTTPNGCWWNTVQVELIDVNIRTGKKVVRVVPNSAEWKSGYDFWNTDPAYIVRK